MKTKLSLSILLSFIFGLLSSQIPQGFNYQAIARDGTGAILDNKSLQVRFYIRSEETAGILFYQELHSSVTTNSFGLFSVVIGKGTPESGTFSSIDWSVSPKWLETDIYYTPIGWKDMGTAQLMSVPYSMTAGDIVGTVDKLAVKGTTSVLDEALFEVKNKDGQTIFAVYNEGVRIYVDDGAKGTKGGFAVGGFDMTKATKREYLVVSDDSVRIYVADADTKGVKGGFAVGGYDATKGLTQKLLTVSNDSVRVYIDNATTDKGLKGGFAVGGYDASKAAGDIQKLLIISEDSARVYVSKTPTKGHTGGFAVGGYDATKGGEDVDNFMSLTPNNYFIGHKSGVNTSGLYNSFLGYETGIATSTGAKNVMIGYNSGKLSKNASFNVFVGNETGLNNTGNFNTFMGYQAGKSNTSGLSNVFIGYETGMQNLTGNNNVFVGVDCGSLNTTGRENVFVGSLSGYSNIGGVSNVFVGNSSGTQNQSGNANIFIGNYSGHFNNSGSNNVAIGNLAFYTGTAGESNVMLGDSAGHANTSSFNVLLGKGTGKSNSGNYNSFIGYHSGLHNTSGTNNVYLGYNAGYSNTTGSSNVAIGNLSAYRGSGTSNVIIGDSAGYISTASYNILLGKGTGKNNTGNYNSFMGYHAGLHNTSGTNNVYLGYNAGYSNTTGSSNVAIGNLSSFRGSGLSNVIIGDSAGYGNTASYNVMLGKGTGTGNTGDYNSFIGYQSGQKNTSGQSNVFIGNQSGKNYTTGSMNTFIGYQAGLASATSKGTGSNNVAMGYQAGVNLTSGFENTLIGKQAGYSVTSGNSNVAIGYLAGKGITTADRNTVVGESSGEKLSSGITNAFYGTYSGRESTSGSGNTFLGYDCGYTNVSGSYNTYVGFMTGRNALSDSSVFIGYQAGYGESLHQRLYIANGPTGNPLIWGDFRHALATIHGSLGINTKTPKSSLHIKSNAEVLSLEGTDHSFIGFYPDAYAGGRKAYLGFPGGSIDDIYLVNGITAGDIVLNPGTSGFVGVGLTDPAFKLHVSGNTFITGDLMIGGSFYDLAPLNVEKWEGLCAYFNRRNTDGQILQFAKTGVEVGSISVASGLVSYNAFTGSHYGVTSDEIEEGKLVIMNGSNSWLHGNEGSEVLYGISESTRANDPAAMGAYLGILESSKPYDSSNPYLIMAEGNGEMWIVDNGENLSPGDMLISSTVKGHAMKDKCEFSESFVVAKVAEPVDWLNVTETIGGLKHRKVSVLFTSFVRNNSTADNSSEVAELKNKVEKLEKLVEQLMEEK